MKERPPRKSGGSRPRKPKVVRPARSRSGLPPPIRHRNKFYWFPPETTAGHVSRDGVPFPIRAAPLTDVLAACPHQMLLSLKDRAAITAFWMVPADPPPSLPTVPEFVLRAALEAVAAGDAFLLFGRNEAAVERAAARISAVINPPAPVTGGGS
jgi:hypothetical protein